MSVHYSNLLVGSPIFSPIGKELTNVGFSLLFSVANRNRTASACVVQFNHFSWPMWTPLLQPKKKPKCEPIAGYSHCRNDLCCNDPSAGWRYEDDDDMKCDSLKNVHLFQCVAQFTIPESRWPFRYFLKPVIVWPRDHVYTNAHPFRWTITIENSPVR